MLCVVARITSVTKWRYAADDALTIPPARFAIHPPLHKGGYVARTSYVTKWNAAGSDEVFMRRRRNSCPAGTIHDGSAVNSCAL